jgi:hypothetical protein
MPEGRKVLVTIKTRSSTYKGTLLIPPMRRRVTDVLNDDDKTFINITDVRIDNARESVPYVSINKNLIESIIESEP